MEEQDIIIAAYVEQDVEALDIKKGDILFYKNGVYKLESKTFKAGDTYSEEIETVIELDEDLINALSNIELITKLEIDLNE